MAVTDTTLPEQAAAGEAVGSPATAGEFEELVGTGDHTSLGRLFLGFSLLLLTVGLAIRLLVGLDLATDNGVLGSYVSMVDVSSLVALVLLGVLPALIGLALIIVPLQVGSPSVAFPRAAALSLWTWAISAGLFIASIALDGGVAGGDYDAASLGNISMGVMMASLGLASVCIATTVITHRPAGLTLARVPLFSWSMLVAAPIWIATFAAATAHVVLGHVAADSAPGLADNFANGLAWMLRGPAVYMLAIPVLGIAGDAVAHATHRALRNYGVFQGLIAAFGVLSFGAWAQGPRSVNTFVWALWALAAALPVLGMLGGLAESMRYGRPAASPGMVGSLLALVVLLGGILVGALMALDTAGSGTLFDFGAVLLGPAQSVFVVAAVIVGLVAGQAHWSGQVWGAVAKSRTVAGAGTLVALGGVLLAGIMAVDVFLIANDTDAAVFVGIVATVGALLMVLGVLGALAASLSAERASFEGDGPAEVDTDGMTLEWQVPWPAVAAQRTAELPAEITSPYPLLEDEEEA